MSTDGPIWTPGNDLLRQARRSVDAAVAPAEPPPSLRHRRTPPVGASLLELWHARRIVRTLTERNLRVRYKQSVLGFLWAVLTPVALLVVLTIVFERGVHVQTDGVSYPLFAFIGLIPWTFFSTSITTGGVSVLSDKALLNKCRFPREVFPLSSVAVATIDSLMTLVPLAVLFLWFGEAPESTFLLALAPLLVLLAFTLGLTLLLSAWVVYVRDVRLLLPIVVQIGLFATPVAYDLKLVPASVRLLYCAANPVAPVIDSLRRTVLLGEAPRWDQLGAGAATATVVLVAGYLLFKRLEGNLADVA